MAKMPTMIMINTQNNYLSGSYFVFGSETMDIIYPNNIADAIPAPVASIPPEKAPITPFDLTASMVPLLNAYPKPDIGTVAPASPNFTKGSYNPMAPRNTPDVRKITKI